MCFYSRSSEVDTKTSSCKRSVVGSPSFQSNQESHSCLCLQDPAVSLGLGNRASSPEKTELFGNSVNPMKQGAGVEITTTTTSPL